MIHVDAENKIVSWREFTFDQPRYFTAKDMLGITGLLRQRDKEGHKRCYVHFNSTYGVRAAVVAKLLNKAMYYMWKVPDWALFLIMNNTGVNIGGWRKFWELKDMLTQMHEDGLDHLLPICFRLEADPQTAKKLLGKSVWKKLCANSKSRNKLLASVDRDIVAYIDTPSTLLMGHFKVPSKHVEAYLTIRPTYKEIRDKGYYHHISDSVNMSEGRWPRHLDTPEKWRAYHDRLVRKRQEIEDRKLQDPTAVCEQHVCEVNEYKFVRLLSSKDLYEEGKIMHHCVHFYFDEVRGGDYLVYRVLRCNEHVGTLGVELRPHVKVHQLQGPCNSRLDIPEAPLFNLLSEIKNELSSRAGHRA